MSELTKPLSLLKILSDILRRCFAQMQRHCICVILGVEMSELRNLLILAV